MFGKIISQFVLAEDFSVGLAVSEGKRKNLKIIPQFNWRPLQVSR